MEIMSEMTEKQQKLVKARHASRVVTFLLIFGGASLLLIGIAQQALPGVMNGITMLASSTIPFVASKIIEKRLNLPPN